MGSGASKHRRELRRVQAAHVLTNTLRHNNRVQQRHRERAELDSEEKHQRDLLRQVKAANPDAGKDHLTKLGSAFNAPSGYCPVGLQG